MDVRQFLLSRNSTLDAFMKKYDYLKSEYSKALSSAITETDIQAREILISRVQSLNTELTTEIRDILTELSKGVDKFNPTSIDELTQQLIKYQKDHQELDQSQDKLKTLKMIKYTTQSRLKEANVMYSIYIFLLILFCFLLAFLVMKTSFLSSSSSSSNTQSASPR